MDKKQVKRLLKFIGISCTLLASSANAQMIFPPAVSYAKTQLKLCSQAELKAYSFISVGNAALYLEDCQQLSKIFVSTPKQLRFAYDTAIPANAFQEASNEYLKSNLGDKYQHWQSAFDQFNSHYQDIKANDYYDLIYSPKSGLLLQLNGKILANLPNQEVALAYLNVWFGEKPFNEDLKKALLKLPD
ncbi:MAG: chalcone isomerase family protein [Methylococcales bacterium]